MMTHKLSGVVFFALISCATCFGQSSFQEITPGTTELKEVERMLGKPLRTISTTRFEYSPPAGIARVEVEFNAGASVARIEVYFLKPVSRPALIKQFNLPQQADAKTTDTQGKLVEYFGDPSLLALNYTSADPGGGVSRVGYYSRELFDNALAKAGGTQNPGTQTGTSQSSNTAGLGEMNLPGYMRPPARSKSVTVDRTGRTKSSNHPVTNTETDNDSIEVEIDLSTAELRRLVGRYNFTITSVPGLKLAVVGLVSGKLRLTMATASNTLVPIAEDDFVVGDRESEVVRFKMAGKPGVKVYFQVIGDKVERLYMLEHQRQPRRFSVAIRQP